MISPFYIFRQIHVNFFSAVSQRVCHENNVVISQQTNNNYPDNENDSNMLSDDEVDNEKIPSPSRPAEETPISEYKEQNTTNNLEESESYQTSQLSNDESLSSQMFSNQSSSCRKKSKKRKSEMFNKSNVSNYKDAIVIICALIRIILVRGSLLIIDTLKYITCLVARYTREESFFKGVLLLPRETIARLFCFAYINSCRRLNVDGYLTLPPSKICNKNDRVLTPCQWPILLLILVFATVMLVGCYNRGLNSPLSAKYKEGLKIVIEQIEYIIADLEIMPGRECMTAHNCCRDRLEFYTRWFQCLFTATYHIALLHTDKHTKLSIVLMDRYINNVTDWRLKRNLKRIRVKLRELRITTNYIVVKVGALEGQREHLRQELRVNFSSLRETRKTYERIETKTYETSKKFEEFNRNLNSLISVKEKFKDTLEEVRKCFRCTIKLIMKELDKEQKNAYKNIKQSRDKLTHLEKLVYGRPHGDNKVAEAVLHSIKNLKKEIEDSMFKVKQMEFLPYQIQSDMKITKKFMMDKIDNDAGTTTMVDHKLKDRFNRESSIFSGGIQSYSTELKEHYISIMMKMFREEERKTKKDLIKTFCPKIHELIKMTVLSQMNVNLLSFHKCSIYSYSTGNDHYYIRVNLDAIKKFQPLNCCITQKQANETISKLLTIYDADRVNTHDYAAEYNGGKIVQSFFDNKWFSLDTAKFMLQPTMSFGNCWNITTKDSSVSQSIVQLSQRIIITHIVLEHILSHISFNGDISEAPKDFQLFALSDIDDKNPILLGNFTYDVFSGPIQTFTVPKSSPTDLISLKINSNHGNPNYTCVYRIRVLSY